MRFWQISKNWSRVTRGTTVTGRTPCLSSMPKPSALRTTTLVHSWVCGVVFPVRAGSNWYLGWTVRRTCAKYNIDFLEYLVEPVWSNGPRGPRSDSDRSGPGPVRGPSVNIFFLEGPRAWFGPDLGPSLPNKRCF